MLFYRSHIKEQSLIDIQEEVIIEEPEQQEEIKTEEVEIVETPERHNLKLEVEV